MRINDFDEEFNFKKKRSSNTLFIIKIVFIIFAIFAILSSVLFLSKMGSSDSYEIEENGERYGNSEFIEYQGKISVPVPSGGRYFLNGVDINSFRTLNLEDRDTRIIGLDKNHVYFGNIAIPDLDPNKLEVIGNGYYTNGINSYFFSPFSELDKESSNYIYPYKKIENAKNLKAYENLELFAVDGDNVYYKGEILKNTDLNTLKIIDKNNEYFADKENVYYRSKLLPIKNSGKLKIVSSEQGDTFLYDEASGYVFIGDYTFDKEKAPYKVIGNNGTNLYNLIFIGKDGIYYYDSEKKKQLKAGDNIFVGNIEEITPNIFTDDENIYYFSAYSVRSGSRKNLGELLSRNTDIYYLDKKDGWGKVKDIREGNIGSIWKKENKYYYFNNLGIFHFTDNTIYKITNKETLNYLLSKADDETDDIKSEDLTAINTDYIRELIKNEKLIAVSGEKKMTITIKYKTDIVDIIFKYSIRIFIVVCFIFTIFKNFRKSRRISNESK